MAAFQRTPSNITKTAEMVYHDGLLPTARPVGTLSCVFSPASGSDERTVLATCSEQRLSRAKTDRPGGLDAAKQGGARDSQVRCKRAARAAIRTRNVAENS